MVAEINECDRHRLQQLLADELSMAQAKETQRHLESCLTCRTELESLAAEQNVWNEMPRYLRRDESDPALPLSQATQSVLSTAMVLPAIETVLERLAESENPAMLGRLGEYDILEVVGAGGMGVVLKGYDRQLNRFVAIKVLAPHFASNAAARTRFAREAKAAAAVVHPHVVSIHGVADAASLPYFIMQYVPGQSLQQRIDSNAPMDIKDVLRIGTQTAQGLAAAHAQGLVHRDIKPANILLENGVERVLISDFGLARAADDASMTQSGVIAGTPQFMSPEQARGEPIDGRSDLFSLGSVLYAMCTGHSPFRAETTVGVLSRIYNESPRPVRLVNSDVPDFLAGILDRLLAKDPAERFQTADEAANCLGGWLAHVQQPDVVPRPAWPARANALADRFPPARVRRVLISACGGLLCLLATILIVLEFNKGTLEIHCDSNVPVKIMRDGQVYDRVTITPMDNQVRIAAGEYVVQLDGTFENLEVENGGDVTIAKRDTNSIRIIRRQSVAPPKIGDKTGIYQPSSPNPKLITPELMEEIKIPAELQKWQGLWTVVRSANATNGPFDDLAIHDFQVQGDLIQVRLNTVRNLPFQSIQPDKLVLDASQSPAEFTFEKKVPIWGIYELSPRGDRLTICFRKSDSEQADVRPKDFDVTDEQDSALYVLQKAPSAPAKVAAPDQPPVNVDEPVFQGKKLDQWLADLDAGGATYPAMSAIEALRVDAPPQRMQPAVEKWAAKVNRERDPQLLSVQIPVLCALAGKEYTQQALDVIMAAIRRQPERGSLSIFASNQQQGPTLLSSIAYGMRSLDEQAVHAQMAKEIEQGNSQARHFALAFCNVESDGFFATGPVPTAALLAAATDKVDTVRRRAIAKLAKLYPDDPATRALLHDALDHQTGIIATDVGVYLSKIDPTYEKLLPRLNTSARIEDSFQQVMATQALLNAAPQSRGALETLFDFLNDPNWGNQTAQIVGPGYRYQAWDQLDVPQPDHELIGRLGVQQNVQFARRTAVLGLGRLFRAGDESLPAEDREKALEILRSHLKHGSKEIRYAAAQAIEVITGESVNVD